MAPTENEMWREALARLDELEDEVKRVEHLVLSRLGIEKPAEAAVVGRPARKPRKLAAPKEPDVVRRVADLRGELDADPLQALDLAYPPGLFAAGTAPERTQRACLLHHSRNTARVAMYVAARHGYQPSTVDVIGICALVHDIGLESVPPELFAKVGSLTGDERRSLQAHAAEGAERVRSFRGLDGLLRAVVPAVVRQHHERVDGSGYPDGLNAPHIHEFARLIALAEAYETMVSPRPYKPAQLPHDAMTTLLLEAFGKGGPERFDRRLATSFLRALSLYPIGSGVRLDSGEVGQVVGANPSSPDRPHVRVLWRPDGGKLKRPRVVDLRGESVAVAEAVALPPPASEAGDGEATPRSQPKRPKRAAKGEKPGHRGRSAG